MTLSADRLEQLQSHADESDEKGMAAIVTTEDLRELIEAAREREYLRKQIRKLVGKLQDVAADLKRITDVVISEARGERG